MRYHVTELYVNYNTFSVTDLYIQRILLLVHNFVYHKDKLSEIHNCNTRSPSNIHLRVPRVDTGYGQRSVCYVGVSLWNNLPDDLKAITLFSTFKAHVKLYMQTKSYADC